MAQYNIIAETDESTVVTDYQTPYKRQKAYQSEADLEKELIEMLQEQKYEYLPIHTEEDLINNLRAQISKLNNYKFSDKEWDAFFNDYIASANSSIADKTNTIQADHIKVLHCDDGMSKNIALIDKKNIHNNSLQVINQYVVDTGKHPNRYDVTILVNGLPLVHVELKRRGVSIREAFNQINRYQRDSFWADHGLFEYVQLFVISNGTNTKYYSNTTRINHINEYSKPQSHKKTKTSNSFEFTSFWADANNKIIPDLIDFTRTFFAKHTLLNILTKYCVFTTEKQLLVMRPYQIVATEKILNRIVFSINQKTWGKIQGGGFVWHTTGSGKTLTSFKAAQMATQIPEIDKVLFVVDRKDLDYQTMKEYDRFEEGAANSNTSTTVLKKQMADSQAKIIITTIQKLSVYIKKYKNEEDVKDILRNKHFVIIFDECHRSQFGDMHKAIIKNFKKYHLFGFTGTPITTGNLGASMSAPIQTTAQVFGDQLHAYTIVDAINDKNVLPFRVEYIRTMDKEDEIIDKQIKGIDRESAYNAPARIELVTKYILDNFNRKTYHNEKSFVHSVVTNIAEVASAKKRDGVKSEKQAIRLNGFNSIFCVSSVEMAKAYYKEFKKQMAEHPEKSLRIATIYSYGANEEEADGIIEEENPENALDLDAPSREFLEAAIKDYNQMFSTNYDTSSDKFQNYYKDVSLRMKNKQLDILIVVNMFLTGFDATTLNTLWVDKNLCKHGLIQAFSRTNRILNSIKTFGNIVCFRNLQKQTDEAIALFGDKNATGVCVLRKFSDYYKGFTDNKGKYHDGYEELVQSLESDYPLGKEIVGEENQKNFIRLFGAYLRMRNLLSVFDEFEGKEKLSERDFQDYQSIYYDLYEMFPHSNQEKEDISDDIVFEIELMRQVEINIDYILLLVKKYHDGHCKDKEILVDIKKAVSSSPTLRSKRELIEEFINSANEMDDVVASWKNYVEEQKQAALQTIITEEKLKPEETKTLMEYSFRDGVLKTTGTDIDKILPPVSRFGGGGGRAAKKKTVIDRLVDFFERFFGI